MNLFSSFSSSIARGKQFVNNPLYLNEYVYPTNVDVSGTVHNDYSTDTAYHKHARQVGADTFLVVENEDGNSHLDISDVIQRRGEMTLCFKYKVNDEASVSSTIFGLLTPFYEITADVSNVNYGYTVTFTILNGSDQPAPYTLVGSGFSASDISGDMSGTLSTIENSVSIQVNGGTGNLYFSIDGTDVSAAVLINGGAAITALDGYIQGGTIKLYDASVTPNVELETGITDEKGQYTSTLKIGELPDVYKVECIGGTDITSTLSNETVLTTIVSKTDTMTNGNENVTSPLTTLLASYIESTGSGSPLDVNTLDLAKTTISTALGISPDEIGQDFISQSNSALVQKTTQLEILANTFVSGTTATDKNVIYSALARAIDDAAKGGSTSEFSLDDATNLDGFVTNLENNIGGIDPTLKENLKNYCAVANATIRDLSGDFTTIVQDAVKYNVLLKEDIKTNDLTTAPIDNSTLDYLMDTIKNDTITYGPITKDDVGKKGTITGFAFYDISLAYSQYIYLPLLTDQGNGGTTVSYSVQTPSNTAATFLGDFVNIDTSGTYTVIASKAGGDLYEDISTVGHISLSATHAGEQYANLKSIEYKTVSRVYEDDTHRYLMTNFWPSFDGWSTYNAYLDYGFPQEPIPRGLYQNLVSLKLPKTPSYPTNPNTCQTYSKEFGDSTEISYNNLHDMQQQGTPGVLGRFTTPNVHWSETHRPSEMLLLDPLPAACGGKFLYGATVDIYVDEGSNAPPYFTFYLDASGLNQLDPVVLDIDKKYKFQRLNRPSTHPFYIKVDPAQSTKIHLVGDGSDAAGLSRPDSFTLYFNGLTTNDSLYYYCTAHPDMSGTFSLVANGPEIVTASNGQTDLMTATECLATWDTDYVTPLDSDYKSFDDSDVSGIYYRPGYYFRYFLDGIQGIGWTELQMDAYGGHIQPDVDFTIDGTREIYGDWHAHTASQLFGLTDYSNCVIGYGVDGTPIIGGGSTVYDENGIDKGIATPSWRRRNPGEYDATWSQDGSGFYIYDYLHDATVAGANLDEFNGGYTTLDGNLTYCYFITETYPIWPRNIRGSVKGIAYDETSEIITYTVTLNGDPSSSPYYIFTDADGVSGTPTLQAGKTYTFKRTDNGHPFNVGGDEHNQNNTGIVVTSTGTNTGTAVNGANSIEKGQSLTFTIPADYAGSLKYFCYSHSNMIGNFTIN
jgi:plastocyanin